MNSIKTTSFIFLLIGFAFSASSQSDCQTDRYTNTEYFDSIKVSMDVAYGSNKGVGTGSNQILNLDVYEPKNDNISNRPLVLFAHGGSFTSGSKEDAAFLCETFAKLGYVAATIEYRVGFFFPVNQVSTTLAVMRGMHDMKAAVRFFRKDAANGNTYGIDTNRIVIGGISAGSITAIHAAYFDEDSEIPAYMQNDTANLGGVEGLSGNPGYSSKVHGVVNYAGAIGDSSWINAGDPPIISFHYTNDQTVPYDTREVNVQGIPTGLTASGSGSMETRLNHINVTNELITYNGSGHVDFLSGSTYDAVITASAAFIREQVVCKSSTGIFGNHFDEESNVQIFPNPSDGNFVLKFEHIPTKQAEVRLYNSLGAEVFHSEIYSRETSLNLTSLQRGIYLLSIIEDGVVAEQKKLTIK